MRIKSVMLALPFLSLYGCQPEAPKPEAAAPVAMEQSAAPASAMQAAPPVANEAAASAPVQQAPVAKAVQPVSKEEMPPAPKQDAPQPAATEEPLAPPPVETAPQTQEAAEVEAVAPPEPAVSEQEFMLLAKKNNCFACHAVAKKVVGPSFRDVAAKYRGDAGAEAWLVEKIAKGGKGVWGVMVMTPSPNLSEADRRTLAKYILSLK